MKTAVRILLALGFTAVLTGALMLGGFPAALLAGGFVMCLASFVDILKESK